MVEKILKQMNIKSVSIKTRTRFNIGKAKLDVTQAKFLEMLLDSYDGQNKE